MQQILKGDKILVAPLDWGLGHAARSIPIIQRLLELGAEVILAGDGMSFRFLRQAYPDLDAYELPSYQIEYPAGWGGAWKTVFKAPKIIRAIREEHQEVQKLVNNLGIGIILSDNRYGVYASQIPSIFIGHQLRVLPPKGFRWASDVILAWHRQFLKHFDEIWVPDFPGQQNLSGILSHGVKVGVPIRYIGPQSRFTGSSILSGSPKENIVALLSGPEPQRTILEDILTRQLTELKLPAVLIRGVMDNEPIREIDNLKIIPYLHQKELQQVLESAKVVICRSGYSTLMDLMSFNTEMILIPTPGQTEQEYLAEELATKGVAVIQKQVKLNLRRALDQVHNTKSLPFLEQNWSLLDAGITYLKNK